MMILAILGVLDIIAGLSLAFLSTTAGFGPVQFIAWVVLLKGVWSVLTSALQGYFWDWMGWLDAIVGASIILAQHGNVLSFIQIIWWIMVLKGIYSIFCSMK